MKFCCLGSGSEGNSIVVKTESSSKTTVLVDCGIKFDDLENRLLSRGIDLSEIDAIFITHEHIDHIRSALKFAKVFNTPIFMTHGSFYSVYKSYEKINSVSIIRADNTVVFNDLKIAPFSIPHDAREPVALIIQDTAHKLGVLTDTGSITPNIVRSMANLDGKSLKSAWPLTKSPVGDDQVPHVELTREIARRFNFLFGGEADFEKKALEASKKLGGKRSRLILELRQKFQEQGDEISLERAKAILQDSQNLTMDDRERLFGYLEGVRRLILVEPQPLLTLASRFTGLDGQKMSKSYGNTIGMREEPDKVVVKLKKMPTDPARVRRSDPGSPENCPVWSLHKIYSNNDLLSWVKDGCKTASIGCVECKKPLIDSIVSEQKVFRERAKPYEEDIGIVKNIIADGCERARDLAKQTMRDVREAMDIDYT